MRKDAEANREKLVLAGKRLMQEQGGNVPVEQFCDVAGVTRGTFYRNFSDRAGLYAAVLEYELAVMVNALSDPDIHPLAFLRLLAEMMVVYDKFMVTLPELDDYHTIKVINSAKIIDAIDAPLRRAQQVGLIDDALTSEDAMLASRMIASDWRLDPVDSREEAMDRRLTIMMIGLTPRL